MRSGLFSRREFWLIVTWCASSAVFMIATVGGPYFAALALPYNVLGVSYIITAAWLRSRRRPKVDWEARCAALYQVIGQLTFRYGLERHPDMVAAMDCAAGFDMRRELLPWPREPLPPALSAWKDEDRSSYAVPLEAAKAVGWLCGDCPDGSQVFWNPGNGVVQCHICGDVFKPAGEGLDAAKKRAGVN